VWMIDENQVGLWDAITGRAIGQPLLHPGQVGSVWSSADGSRLVTLSDSVPDADPHDGAEHRFYLQLWDARTAERLAVLEGPKKSIHGVAFHPTSHQVVAAGEEGVLFVWSADDGRLLHRIDDFDWFGVRRGSAAVLNFAPVAVRGPLVLAEHGDVRELEFGRVVAPAAGRKFADEARQFAVDGRWLATPDALIDLAVEQSLTTSGGALRIARDGVGWACFEGPYPFDGTPQQIWTLPERPETLAADDVAAWAELLVCGELGGNGQFRAFDEDEWESRRRRLAARLAAEHSFRFPGFDPEDRRYWLRRKVIENGVLHDRLIAAEPTFGHYLLRAQHRGKNGNYAGSLADQLEAARFAGPAAWSAVQPAIQEWHGISVPLREEAEKLFTATAPPPAKPAE
ncbi:MAG: WD40 repeat domain-containing protein, partial [Planctomycetaceae bacterium]